MSKNIVHLEIEEEEMVQLTVDGPTYVLKMEDGSTAALPRRVVARLVRAFTEEEALRRLARRCEHDM